MYTLRNFYEKNNIPKSLLFKDNYLRVARVLIPATKGENVYDKNCLPEDDLADVERLKLLRMTNDKKFRHLARLTDQQILYLINKETLKFQEGWS
jgi:hypothetical protein